MEFRAEERQRGKAPCATLQLLTPPKWESSSKPPEDSKE